MAATASPQYQHFVPRFLLKNFSHPYKPNGEHPKRRRGGAGRKYEKGMFPNDPVVRNVDLLADPPVICEKPVARILGEINMYQDTTKPPDQQHAVEAMLSELESRAGQVFRKIAKAFEQKETGIWLSRDERDLVRKFLFLLKYRSDGMRRRFFHQAPEDYSENDRELMREYMARHGFKRPLDVWFHNIKTIIKLNMDLDNKWILDLTKQMYPDDAMWFVSHVQSYYMAFCTPASDKDEFILTDNSYGVFEGPNHFVKDIGTGKVAGDVHTPLHLFAPVSPKLMIVLRLVVLPEPLENADEEIRNHRALERFLAVDSVYGYEVESLLADLPIAKARNNYTTVVDGRLRLASGEDGKRRKDHKFCFKFFPIGSEHVHMINALLLDNAAPCSSIVFESQDAFARTLEWYLTAPCSIGKLVIGPDSQLRRATLKKLEKISRDLGSDKETVWLEVPELPAIDYEARRAKITAERRKLHRILEQPDAEAVRRVIAEESKPKPGAEQQSWPYLLLGRSPDPMVFGNHRADIPLGGSLETFMEDLTQAERMWTLRVKIDSWSAGKVDESIRQRNRELLLEAYLRLPPRRVWLYIKSIREAMLASPEGTDKSGAIVPEDAVARGELPEISFVEFRLCRIAQG